MRQRGFSNLTTVVVAALLALLVAPLFMGIMVVDVNVKGPEPHHLWIPLPLGVARVALAFVPDDEVSVAVPRELAEKRELVGTLLDGLAGCGDATLLSVRSPEATVEIATRGGVLQLDVDAPDARVHGSFRIAEAREALASWDGSAVSAGQALNLLLAAGRGQKLEVHSDEADVSIRIF